MSLKLPEAFLKKMEELLGAEFPDYLASFQRASYSGLRVNTDKISVEAFKKLWPFELEAIPWTSNGFYLEDKALAAAHPFYQAGLYYLQEPSAMLPAAVLPVERDDLILDCCGAPGGKADELLNKLAGSGVLISNDISASRAKALLRNLEKHGAERYYVISEDIMALNERFVEQFDKILIDAPCSGEGMFRKDPSLIKNWHVHSCEEYAALQKKIAARAVKFLKPGGSLVYSTCTFSKEENEEVIAHLLAMYPKLQIEPIAAEHGFKEGFIKGTVRLYPHHLKGEGHFVACLKKQGSLIKQPVQRPVSLADIAFFEHINKQYNAAHLEQYGDSLYLCPDLPFALKGIRVLRSGLFLGELKKGRFEPSQALAVSLRASEFDQVLDLEVGDERVERYLRGETITIDNNYQGWVLILVAGQPLGFGKAAQGLLNNKIAKGWRKL